MLISKHFNPETDDLESYTIVSLLHDLCKAGFTRPSSATAKRPRRVGKGAGLRSRRPVSVRSRRKSVFLIEAVHAAAHRKRSPCAGTWAALTSPVKGGSFALAHAFEKYPLAVKLHLSDLEATYLHENRGE